MLLSPIVKVGNAIQIAVGIARIAVDEPLHRVLV